MFLFLIRLALKLQKLVDNVITLALRKHTFIAKCKHLCLFRYFQLAKTSLKKIALDNINLGFFLRQIFLYDSRNTFLSGYLRSVPTVMPDQNFVIAVL